MDEPAFNAPLVEWACHYAKKGVPVFPVAPKTKIPLKGSRGVDDATTDLETIRKWWAKNPAANIGAACGHKFDVADLDGKLGKETFNSKSKASDVQVCVKTPSGGFHVYYEPTLVPLTNGVKREPGIDLRTKGGYVLMPPSFVIDEAKEIEGHYEWFNGKHLNGQALPNMPRWLQESFKRDKEHSGVQVVPEVLPEGERNDRLFRFGCSMRRKGAGEYEITAALLAMNEIRCRPKLSDHDIKEIAKSCCRYEPEPERKDYPGPKPWEPYTTKQEAYERAESRFLKLSSITGKPVDWLFHKRFAKGMLSAVQGDPGEGKSTIARAIATMVTTGQAPDFWGMRLDGPRDVIWLTKEESLVYSVVPVLSAMGADLDRIHALDMGLDEDGKLPPEFVFDDWGIQQLRELVEATQAAVIIIDPLVAFFDSKTDMHRQNETRSILARLIIMAEQTGCVPIGIVHQAKAKNSNALLNILGSVDFGAAVRTAFLVGHDPDDRTKKAFVQTKSNLGPFADGIGFEIDEDGSILWNEDCHLDAERLNEPPSVKAVKEKVDSCRDWLETELGYGQCEFTSLLSRAKDQGFSKNTLFRAADDLKVSRGYQPTAGRGRGPAWWAKQGYDWRDHEWPDPYA